MRQWFWSLIIIFGVFASTLARAQCPKPELAPEQRLTDSWYVVDGDTVNLGAGQRLRLALINTPELGRDGAPNQVFAIEAKQAARTFLQTSQRLYLLSGFDANMAVTRDHYGRTLGLLYNAKGEWLGADLVSQGLAFVVSIPPHVAPNCLWQMEASARELSKGLWGTELGQVVPASAVKKNHAGFVLLNGKVTQVVAGKQDWFVDLDGDLVLRINKKRWRENQGESPHTWLDQTVDVRGWLTWRRLSSSQQQRGFKRGVMRVSHPHMLAVVP